MKPITEYDVAALRNPSDLDRLITDYCALMDAAGRTKEARKVAQKARHELELLSGPTVDRDFNRGWSACLQALLHAGNPEARIAARKALGYSECVGAEGSHGT